jgi:acyl-CoA synthetase (AMP-forming)/AMP-acid ligase II
MHTCNPRLSPQQLIHIINHAEDQIVLFDATFAPLVKGIAVHCPQVRAWVCLAEAAHTPTIEGVANVLAYEDLIAPCSSTFSWPSCDERTAAALCYTSGTTGNPKGALYSHRSIVLNALTGCLPGVLSLAPDQTILPVVPMFHINAWCIPYAAPIAGAKLVLPGPKLDGQSLYELMEAEAVTISAGVPTIWQGLLAHPAVAMAAVIGVKHPKWDERPLLFLLLKPGQAVKKDEILAFLGERVPKWWVPDDVVFLDALPVGGTGKVQKGDLRKQYGGAFS